MLSSPHSARRARCNIVHLHPVTSAAAEPDMRYTAARGMSEHGVWSEQAKAIHESGEVVPAMHTSNSISFRYQQGLMIAKLFEAFELGSHHYERAGMEPMASSFPRKRSI